MFLLVQASLSAPAESVTQLPEKVPDGSRR